MTHLRALDLHCHPCLRGASPIEPDSAVFAQTVSPAEWDAHHTDPLAGGGMWGLGLHPWWTFEDAQIDAFLERVTTSAAIGEVGLDGTGNAPRGAQEQQQALIRVLDHPGTRERLVSLHGWGASDDLVAVLAEHPCPGAILHWWTGTGATFERSRELDVFYTVNDAMFADPQGQGRVLGELPMNRVLTETDAPFIEHGSGQGIMGGALFPWTDATVDAPEDIARRARSGAVRPSEESLARLWKLEVEEVRLQLWRNLAELESRVAHRPFAAAEVVAAHGSSGV